MAKRGRLTEWNDDRGFGFVSPLDGGSRCFAHVSQFPRDLRRPQLNDLVTYDHALDERGRLQARNVTYLAPAHSKDPGGHPEPPTVPLALAAAFLVVLVTLASVGVLQFAIVGLYGLMSVLLFVTYAQDKAAAQSGRWRTPESTLHLMALLGGWPGGLVAQGVFRHKTRKQPFRAVFFVTVVANGVILILYIALSAAALG